MNIWPFKRRQITIADRVVPAPTRLKNPPPSNYSRPVTPPPSKAAFECFRMGSLPKDRLSVGWNAAVYARHRIHGWVRAIPIGGGLLFVPVRSRESPVSMFTAWAKNIPVPSFDEEDGR